MALVANISYSKKIPVDGQDYSSQGYSLSLQTEISESDPIAIQNRLHETFELVKKQVESELAGNHSSGGNVRDFPAPSQHQDRANNGSQPKATNKQINYLTSLASSLGIAISELGNRARELYGASSLYDLSRRDASKLVDDLKRLQQKAA
jgi:hypothetical protein